MPYTPSILAATTADTWLVGAVLLASLIAAVYLASKWARHGKAPEKSKPKPKPKPSRPRVKPAQSLPPVPPASPTPLPLGETLTTLADRRAWACERVVHWWAVANRAHGASIDDVPTVQFSPRLKHALGWADSRRNLIRISDWHLMDKSIRVADETVAHEVAHIFADRHYGKPCRHGKLWKKTMVAMGQRPDVTYKDTPQDEAEPEPATSAA